MPLFEYTCHDCGKRFEALVMGGRVPACPGCGSSTSLEKLYSTFGTRSTGSPASAAASRFT